MRSFYLFSCLAVATVMARPEPPVYMGLQQQDQRALPLNAHAVKPHVYQQLPQEYSFENFAAHVPTYSGPLDSSSSNTLAPTTVEVAAIGNMPQEDSYNAAYHHSSTQHHQVGYDNGPTETQVHKHIYIHVPPKDFEEEDAIQPRITHQGGPKQKHYKIVFIKAPAAPTMLAPIIPPAPQNEEKTLIYVLHKKPETQPDIIIPTQAPTKPSKPEVYFIKYKTKKDETPVYGPPPATADMQQPRQALEESNIENNRFLPMDMAATQQPAFEGEQPLVQSDFVNQEPISAMNNFVDEKPQPTAAAEPPNYYLSPETTPNPIVAEDIEEQVHVPAATYSLPDHSRFFIKKRK